MKCMDCEKEAVALISREMYKNSSKGELTKPFQKAVCQKHFDIWANLNKKEGYQ